MGLNQLTDKVLMIRPGCFYANPETTQDNAFQFPVNKNRQTSRLAQKEFDRVVAALEQAGITVSVIQDNPRPETPDAIFPNNRVSFHGNGLAVAYPMRAENRRTERALDVFSPLEKTGFFSLKQLYDYTGFEYQQQFLEGTGSMILDREHKRVFAALSGRTDPRVVQQFCQDLGYEPFLFEAGLLVKNHWQRIYHTNVMLSIGDDFAIIALGAIKDPQQAENISLQLKQYGKTLIFISVEQISYFCANILQLKNKRQQKIIVMSKTAYDHLDSTQINRLEKESKIIYIDIPLIEQASGGSVRCMLAEIF